MGKIFYIMGKSSSGKDTIYEELLADTSLRLRPVILYTTRPIRAGETDGVQYHFVTKETLEQMQEEGRVIELRSYNTVYGIWYYFTADGAEIDLGSGTYLAIGTLESYKRMRDYYGAECVLPVYVEVDDRERLLRAIRREAKQEVPNYKEVCRRYLADEEDFTEEKILAAGIEKRFLNNEEREICIREIASYIEAHR